MPSTETIVAAATMAAAIGLCLARSRKAAKIGSDQPSPKVYLVGAGPGSADLITVRGLELLKRADVVLNDRLVAPELLRYCKPGCRILNVGKSSEKERFSQKDLEKELIEEARRAPKAGVVVRLKGGDPYIYGLGGSEGLALDEAGIEWEYVPGLSSTTALPGLCLRAPLTHKGVSSGFIVLSGHLPPTGDSEWIQLPKCAEPSFTLVVIMCAKNLKNITDFLRTELGWSPNIPAAVIHSGSTPSERALQSTLDIVADVATAQKMDEAPLTLVIGRTLDVFSQKSVPVNRSSLTSVDQHWGNARPNTTEPSSENLEDWWVFGYGSLVWKSSADIPHLSVEDGFVEGYVRRFWQSSPDHRGTEENPGRVVTLLPVNVARKVSGVPDMKDERVFGRVFRVDPFRVQETRDKLTIREKAGYDERQVDVFLKNGTKIRASVFIALPENDHFHGPESMEAIAEKISTSVGPSGLNIEYFDELFTALSEMQMRWGEANRVVDDHILELARELSKIRSSKNPSFGPAT